MDKKQQPVKKVGITGAAGNIGTTLQKGLCENYDLFLYDIKEIRQTLAKKCIKVDFANKEELKGIFNGLDVLIHLAGNPRPDAQAAQTLRNNFVATSFVFEEAKATGVKKIVFASSNFYHEGAIAEALREGIKHNITLDMPPTPLCLYGVSKVYAENLGRHLSYFDMQFVALRIGWTIPEDNPARYGTEYMRAVFCSKRDLIQAFAKAIEIETDFLTAFAVSNNTRNVFDLTETKKNLGFLPQDNAEDYF